jgi:hypothetical protein
MNTVIKVSVLTDDEALKGEIEERLEALAQGLIADDPEGEKYANVLLESKVTVMPRAYMENMTGRPTMQRVKARTSKPRARKS